ncbi:relaxase/mobilization nuclease domain-containing protein [Pseudorhodobacter sp. W20_MBD10_FR17]|uniref:relaxase/mobilization nuclease domain-containing protein n=1 Tax=Pseudorhodobacter sp. W20_MBD10_FR17 TaxID=3240266 RepID=UPI003F9C2996
MSTHDPIALYHAIMGEVWAEDDIRAKGGRDRAGLRQARSFKRAGQPSVRNILKAASGSRAAVFKRIRNGGCKTPQSLRSQLDYVNDKAAFTYSNQINCLAAGETLSDDQKAAIIEQWAGTWRGTSKLGFTSHMLLSFPKDVSAKQVQGIALDWCEHFFESGHYGDKWDYLVAVHTDRDHPHAHILLNNRGSVMGEWFACWAGGNMSPQLMREKQAEIAEDYGIALHAITRLERGLTAKPAGLAEIYAAKAEGRAVTETALSAPEADQTREVIMGFVEDYHDIGDLLDKENRTTLANAMRLMQNSISNGTEWAPKQGEIDMAEIQTVGDAVEYAQTQIDALWADADNLMGVQRAELEIGYAPVLAELYQMVPDPERRAAFNQELVDVYPPGAGVYDLADRFVDAAQRDSLAAVLQEGQDLGLDTDEVLARMEAGGTKNHGLAQEWIERDLTAILAKDGIDLGNSTSEQFDAALEKLDGFQGRLAAELGIEMESPFEIVEQGPHLSEDERHQALDQANAEWLAGDPDYLGRLAEEAYERRHADSESIADDQAQAPNAYIRQIAQDLRSGNLTTEQEDALQRSLVFELHQELGDEGLAELDRGNWEILDEVLPSKLDQISVTQKYLEVAAEERGEADLSDVANDLNHERARARAAELTMENPRDRGLDDDMSM